MYRIRSSLSSAPTIRLGTKVGNKAVGWAWEQETDRPIDKMVLVALADYAAKDGFSYPSHRELASMAQCSTDTVQRALKRLIKRELIEKETRWRDNGGRSSNGYTVLYLGPDTRPKPHEGDDGPPRPPLPQNAVAPLPQNAAGYAAPSGGGMPQLCGMQCDPSLDPPLEDSPSHPPEKRVCASGGNPLEEVRADGIAPHVVEGYLAQLWGALKLPKDVEPLALMRAIRTTLSPLEPEVVRRAAEYTLKARSVWPSTAQALAIAEQAAKDTPLTKYWSDHPAFAAWVAHYRATGRAFWARECEQRRYVQVRSEVPPANGRAA